MKNNADIPFIVIRAETERTWLPHALVDIGLFESGGDVKRKRPEFWRDIEADEILKIGVFRLILWRKND